MTKKLEKFAKKLIGAKPAGPLGKLGKWKATLFYANRKKYWLLTNGNSRYNLILADIKASDLKNIEAIFKESFYAQLVYDGIIVDFAYVEELLGALSFAASDNDRSLTGFQNQRLFDLDWWKSDVQAFESSPPMKWAGHMNTNFNYAGKGQGNAAYFKAKDRMQALLA